MRVLVTGATGYVGSRVAERLAERGESVLGSVRAVARGGALPSRVTPVELDFDTPDAWGAATTDVDAVIHTAFASHDADWGRAVERERAVIGALVKALAGSGKTLIVSNGTAFLGDAGSERLAETASVLADHPAAPRAFATEQVRGADATGFRAIELRLASFVYGHGGSVFLPKLIAASKRDGRSIYVGDGAARTSTLHVDDAASAYLAALDRGRAGAVYHIAAEAEPTIREIPVAVSAAAGEVPVVSVDLDEATRALDPFTAWFLTLNNRLDASLAHADLGWLTGGHPPLTVDVASGSYASG